MIAQTQRVLCVRGDLHRLVELDYKKIVVTVLGRVRALAHLHGDPALGGVVLLLLPLRLVCLVVKQLELVVEGAGATEDGGSGHHDPGTVDTETDRVRRSVASVPRPRTVDPTKPVWCLQAEAVGEVGKPGVRTGLGVGQLGDDAGDEPAGLVDQLLAVLH